MEPIDFGCGKNLNEGNINSPYRYSMAFIMGILRSARLKGIQAICKLATKRNSEEDFWRSVSVILGTGAKKMIFISQKDGCCQDDVSLDAESIDSDMKELGMLKIVQGKDRIFSDPKYADILAYCSQEVLKYVDVVSPLLSEDIGQKSIGFAIPRKNSFRDTLDEEFDVSYAWKIDKDILPIRIITDKDARRMSEECVIPFLREIGTCDAIEAIDRISIDLRI
jgi:hypothetical protein